MGMLKVDRYALPNVLAGADLAPELMQADCTPDKLAEAVLGWFRNPDSVASLQARSRENHEELRQDASSRAADAVAALLGDLPRGRNRSHGRGRIKPCPPHPPPPPPPTTSPPPSPPASPSAASAPTAGDE